MGGVATGSGLFVGGVTTGSGLFVGGVAENAKFRACLPGSLG